MADPSPMTPEIKGWMPGDKTRWGTVAARGILSGERYYWFIKRGVVSMMPACSVEPDSEGPVTRAPGKPVER
jgi:hypothetical protein